MLAGPDANLKARIKSLRQHLSTENPLLVSIVDRFCELDKLAYKLGIISSKQSYTTDISWWPLISILGTFSAGKSTFINHYVQKDLQKTGNQAVDDKFTVICFSSDDKVRVLPGLALDADPRFPFYQISEWMESSFRCYGGSLSFGGNVAKHFSRCRDRGQTQIVRHLV